MTRKSNGPPKIEPFPDIVEATVPMTLSYFNNELFDSILKGMGIPPHLIDPKLDEREVMFGHEPFVLKIEENPEDDGPLLMWADWCAERSHTDFSHALWWMVAEGKRPVLLPDWLRIRCRFTYQWVSDDCLNETETGVAGSSLLPATVFRVPVPSTFFPKETNDESAYYDGHADGHAGKTNYQYGAVWFMSWEWAAWWLALRLKVLREQNGENTGPWPKLPEYKPSPSGTKG